MYNVVIPPYKLFILKLSNNILSQDLVNKNQIEVIFWVELFLTDFYFRIYT